MLSYLLMTPGERILMQLGEKARRFERRDDRHAPLVSDRDYVRGIADGDTTYGVHSDYLLKTYRGHVLCVSDSSWLKA